MRGVALATERRRILVVDDIELNRTLTEAVLRGATYDVDSVGDGAAALAALEAQPYDLVLMDLDMPGLHGHDAAAAIRERRRGGVVRLAALSSHSRSRDIRRSGEVGMAAHIVRPIAPHALLREIERVFRLPTADETAGADPWQRKAYDDWASRLGAERMNGVLRSLRDQLDALLLLTFEDDTPRLQRLAHDAASTAGMLGFLDVMTRCRAVQEASAEDVAGTGIVAILATLRAALEAAIARIGRHFANEASAAQAA